MPPICAFIASRSRNSCRTARRPSGIESPLQDHRRSGRQSLRRLRLFAQPSPIDRIRSKAIRWRAAVKRLLPAAYLSSSPTTDRLPRLPPSTIYGSGEVSRDRPHSTNFIVHSWFMLSKKPRMSVSSTQFTRFNQCLTLIPVRVCPRPTANF